MTFGGLPPWPASFPGCGRKIDSGMARQFNVVVELDREGFYVASIPELKGCHTQARSLDELLERIREAAELCLEVEGRP